MSARGSEEWKKYWPLPLAGALGYSGSVLHIYALGPFMEPIQEAFGWNRTQIFLGIAIATAVNAVVGILVGSLLDRVGPRRVALAGMFVIAMAFSLLGTATGAMLNWIFLWVLVAVGVAGVQPTIWTSAVATRFDKYRGLAIAVTISGTGIAGAVLPLAATWSIDSFGWRLAFLAIGGIWALIAFPIVFFVFRGSADSQFRSASEPVQSAPLALSGVTARESLLSPAFIKIAAAGVLFTFPVFGLIPHFVPVLTNLGVDRGEAAGIAGLVGLASIAGRFGAGYLIDRLPAERVVAVGFALPALAAALLLFGDGRLSYSVAAILIGVSIGAEIDGTIYLATRHFGLRSFGIIYATMLAFFTVSVSLGPLAAGAVYDHFESYRWFLAMIAPLATIGAILIASIGPTPRLATREPSGTTQTR